MNVVNLKKAAGSRSRLFEFERLRDWWRQNPNFKYGDAWPQKMLSLPRETIELGEELARADRLSFSNFVKRLIDAEQARRTRQTQNSDADAVTAFRQASQEAQR
jgi:hypothetical protein